MLHWVISFLCNYKVTGLSKQKCIVPSLVEIEDYSIAYFDLIATFEATELMLAMRIIRYSASIKIFDGTIFDIYVAMMQENLNGLICV